MGIRCEINLSKPLDGVFVPGNTISGVVKYAVDKETLFSRIIVSLKGNGHMFLKDKYQERINKMARFIDNEDYIDIDYVITDDNKNCSLPAGTYETKFIFKLPNSIPPSLKCLKNTSRYVIWCSIEYYIRIKFERPGFMSFPKRFKKDITIVSGVTTRLPLEPVINEEEKKLFQLIPGMKKIINIKAKMEVSAVNPGGNVKLYYEIQNNTNVNISGVKTKLVEVYNLISEAYGVLKLYHDIKDTEMKSGAIKCGNTQNIDIEMFIPSDLGTIENSNLLTRNYIVNIIIEIPFPHRDAVLLIPLKIGKMVERIISNLNDPPPSYWEIMNEENEWDNSQLQSKLNEAYKK